MTGGAERADRFDPALAGPEDLHGRGSLPAFVECLQ
jgi:hypothetical protein